MSEQSRLYAAGSLFERAVSDFRWMLNVRRARSYRRRMTFSQRRRFDAAMRPAVDDGVMAYPDAFYHLTGVDDILRGLEAAYERPFSRQRTP